MLGICVAIRKIYIQILDDVQCVVICAQKRHENDIFMTNLFSGKHGLQNGVRMDKYRSAMVAACDWSIFHQCHRVMNINET